MFSCPHCAEQGIPALRKSILSPGLLATCESCGKPSGIKYASWLTAMIPGSALMITALFTDSTSVEWTLNIVGFLLVIAVPLLFTPLHKEQH